MNTWCAESQKKDLLQLAFARAATLAVQMFEYKPPGMKQITQTEVFD